MKLMEIYRLGVETGMAKDPRGRSGVEKELAKAKRAYEKLDETEKSFFDTDSLWNPYADSRLLVGDPEREVRRILVGVDIDAGEMMLTEALAQRGKPIDAVFAHHPQGRARARLCDVMYLQPGAMANYGVLKNISEALMDERAREVEISTGVSNYNRTADAAKLLDCALFCLHTPCDNMANAFVGELMEQEQPETLDDVCKLLRSIPEYASAARDGNPPSIVSGTPGRSAGKVFVDFTGGTGGPKEYARLLSDAGVSTVICMHMRQEALDMAREAKLNVVIAGHMPSDSIGINLVLDLLEARGVDIVPCSGLIRVSRLGRA